MTNKKGIIAETNRSTLKGKVNFLKSLISLNVFADEPTKPEGNSTLPTEGSAPNNPTQQSTVNYEDLIAKARKEEKDKLYPRIKSLETEVENWTTKCNQHLITIGNKDKEIEALNVRLSSEGKGDSEIESKYKKEVETLTKEIETLKTSKVDEKAIEEKVRAEYEVKLYRETQLREAGDSIIPELITGLTKEDIDASVKISKARFKELTDKILGGATAGIPPANTSTMESKNFNIADLAKMDPRSKEYKEFRTKMGLK